MRTKALADPAPTFAARLPYCVTSANTSNNYCLTYREICSQRIYLLEYDYFYWHASAGGTFVIWDSNYVFGSRHAEDSEELLNHGKVELLFVSRLRLNSESS
jgi:hypothetical protein